VSARRYPIGTPVAYIAATDTAAPTLIVANVNAVITAPDGSTSAYWLSDGAIRSERECMSAAAINAMFAACRDAAVLWSERE